MKDDPASLDRLNGLAVPDPVPFWPPAPGWWLLLAVLLVVAAVVLIRSVRRHRANAYRRAALAELDRLQVTADLVGLLKRTALSAWPREDVASLGGERWIAWLGETGSSTVPPGLQPVLLEAPYSDPGEAAPHALREFVANWIRSHRR